MKHPCCNVWTQWHEFKTRTRLFAFHIALIPLRKVWIQLVYLQLWVNSCADWALQPFYGNQSGRRKTDFKPVNLLLKIDLVSHLPMGWGWINIYTKYNKKKNSNTESLSFSQANNFFLILVQWANYFSIH